MKTCRPPPHHCERLSSASACHHAFSVVVFHDKLYMTTVFMLTVGELVTVNKEKAKIIVTADMQFSKRYLKYLAKKYLKKHSVRSCSFLYAVLKPSLPSC